MRLQALGVVFVLACGGDSTVPPHDSGADTTAVDSGSPEDASSDDAAGSADVNDTGATTDFCAGLTVLPTINATWGVAGSWQSTASGAFGDKTVWVFKLVVPSATPTSTQLGRFTVSEYQGPSTFRQETISRFPCDFRPTDDTGANGPFAVSNGTTADLYYGVGPPSLSAAGLSAGQTYYVNARNWQLDPTPAWSCGQATCNALMNDQPATP
jgi:hypothetical protein